MTLTWAPGVCAPVVWAINGTALLPVIPAGTTTSVSFSQTTYQAVPEPGYWPDPAQRGALIITHVRPVTLTVPPES